MNLSWAIIKPIQESKQCGKCLDVLSKGTQWVFLLALSHIRKVTLFTSGKVMDLEQFANVSPRVEPKLT